MINVIGMGYIGLPTALMLAASGQEVVGSDYNKKIIEMLNEGKLTFEEEGIEYLFEKASTNNIKFTTSYVAADIYIVAVPTPYDKKSKKIDVQYVISAIKCISSICSKQTIIVIESTVSPGTIDKFIRPLISSNSTIDVNKKIHLVHAPERILPGNMLHELKCNPRTIGADNEEVGAKIKHLYKSFCEAEIVVTDIKTAEMSKVVENAYRDVNIAFANELLKICYSGNMDVYNIIKIANMHPRVNILNPGPGVGGHCISVDPWFLVGDYPGLANIILAARKINDAMPEFVLERIYEIMKKHHIQDVSRIGLYGLTYKENVEDVRESPTLQIINCMNRHLSFGISVYDPYVKDNLCEHQFFDFNNFLDNIECIVILVAHNHIMDNMDKIKEKIILDTRNCCGAENAYKL